MPSIADLNGTPKRLRVEVKDEHGRPTGEVLEYWIPPLTYADHGPLQRWVDEHFPDPIEQAWEAIRKQEEKGKPFNVAQQQFMMKTAQELASRAGHPIGTEEADRLLMSAEGTKRILLTAIRKGDPSFDDAAAEKLLMSMGPLDVLKVYAATQLDLVMTDPKAPPLDATPPSRPIGSTASRRTRRARARSGGKSGTS